MGKEKMIKNKVTENKNEKAFEAKERSLLPYDEGIAKIMACSVLKGLVIGIPIFAALYVAIYYCSTNKIDKDMLDSSMIKCWGITLYGIVTSWAVLSVYSKELYSKKMEVFEKNSLAPTSNIRGNDEKVCCKRLLFNRNCCGRKYSNTY
ncbi:hypothetical protein NLO413_0147 [Candidatus Neoehrlichia lotoris str. RAC413]|uniref:Uncharacterized protein n=2 Tax=Candidatus Neoehrlichia procyonis TaxID=467750 RepID=A0A0F3NL52_9RICK|nr:hypothetical protein NLO413_0147 [Candidatus Neoehrlichia lotoris str. RAC413]